MEPIFDDHCILQKPDVKGGWTFISMPVMPHLPKKKGSTTVRVRGFIDQYELKNFNIWAMKKGTFLAVKADDEMIARIAKTMEQLELLETD